MIRSAWICVFLLCIVQGVAADSPHWTRASPKDRARANPYANQDDAVRAGRRLFDDHCAKCHGADALGRGKRPNLRSREVQEATDGEIFWLLTNGSLRKGMPSWSALPEASRWQLVTFLKSLRVAEGSRPAQQAGGPENEP
ncbi:MAG TPA: c-type cytochrome [Terriglobales bacterium]|nr:c-type cytochrome [Terriglobales bacterium]